MNSEYLSSEILQIEEQVEQLLRYYLCKIRRLILNIETAEPILKILLSCYNYIPPEIHFADAVSILHMLRTYLSNLPQLPSIELYSEHARQKLASLLRQANVSEVLVIDCLGLIELSYLTTRSDIELKRIYVLLNVEGSTRFFRNLLQVDSLEQLAKLLGGSTVRKIDLVVHKELEKPQSYSELLYRINQLVNEFTNLIRSVCRYECLLVLSDHGYDIVKTVDERYYITHGLHVPSNLISLSRLALILLVTSFYD